MLRAARGTRFLFRAIKFFSSRRDGLGTDIMSSHNRMFRLRGKRAISFPQPHGVCEDLLKDRLNVRGRASDYAEDLGRCRLLLQSLVVRVACLNSLNSRRSRLRSRLVCKGFQAVRSVFPRTDEPRSGGSERADRPPRAVMAHQSTVRNRHFAEACASGNSLPVCGHLVVYGLFADPLSPGPRLSTVNGHFRASGRDHPCSAPVEGRPLQHAFVGIRRPAQPCGVLSDGLQHWLNIRRRAGDDSQESHSSPFAVPTTPLSS